MANVLLDKGAAVSERSLGRKASKLLTGTSFEQRCIAPFYWDVADDFSPFGSDEGAEIWESVQLHAEAVRQAETVEAVLGLGVKDPREFVENIGFSQPDLDAVVIGAGFSLARLTGSIDCEGAGWVLAALERLHDFYGESFGDHYEVMRRDVAFFSSGGQEGGPATAGRSSEDGVRRRQWISVSVERPPLLKADRIQFGRVLGDFVRSVGNAEGALTAGDGSANDWVQWWDGHHGHETQLDVTVVIVKGAVSKRGSVRRDRAQDVVFATVEVPLSAIVESESANQIAQEQVNAALTLVARKHSMPSPPT